MTRLPPKKDVALALLELATVLVHLDPRGEEVGVPAWFKRQPQLVLQIGLNMPKPIPDLAVDEQGISCTLSFSNAPHFCRLPWSAVYALIGANGRGMVWPDDVPKEVAGQYAMSAPKEEPKPRATLAVVAPSELEQAAKVDAKKQKRSRKAKEAKETDKATRAARPRKPKLRVQPALVEAPREAPRVTPAAVAVPARRAAAPAASRGKKKRELPPYLRVVK